MTPANGCAECGEDFAYLSAFDAHRIGTHDYTYSEGIRMEPMREDGRRCLTVEEMTEAGWTRDRWGRWQTGLKPRAVERVEL